VSFSEPEPFDSSRHDAAAFDCGNDRMNDWLRRMASQGDRRSSSRTFVTLDETGSIAGYYSLAAFSIAFDRATVAVRRSLSPHFDVPGVLLALLAVDRRHQGKGLGADLVRAALRRILIADAQIAVRAIVVDAIDDAAVRFYEHLGFVRTDSDPSRLMITVAELKASI